MLYLSLKHHKEKYIKKGCQNRVIYQSLNSHFSHYPTSFDISSESVNIQILSHLLSSLRNYLAFSESFSEPSSTGAVTGSSFRMHGDTETLPLAASLACFGIKKASAPLKGQKLNIIQTYISITSAVPPNLSYLVTTLLCTIIHISLITGENPVSIYSHLLVSNCPHKSIR